MTGHHRDLVRRNVIQGFSYSTIPPEDEALRAPVRALLRSVLEDFPVEQRVHSWMGFNADFSRALGNAGFLGLTLPAVYGGRGLGAFARFIVVEELLAAGAPVAAHWIADRQSAPLILKYGSEAQRERYLPGVCRGETYFCIGMSEPGSGSDLASVRTRAERIPGGWRLDGQKVWTTNAHRDDYMIALVRTGPADCDRHAGLSQVIVDLRSPGVTVRPITDLTGEAHFAEVFFDAVELPNDAIVGQEGAGWAQVTAELAFERSGPERIYSSLPLLDAWIRHLQDVGRTAGHAAEQVGRLMAELAVLRALSISLTSRLERGESPTIEASLVKDLGVTFEQSVPGIIGDDLGGHPDEPIDAGLYRALVYVTQIAPSFSLRGGTREILRGIVARGLGLR